ncbi:hypothetical protein AMTR_s00007p00042900 [Amborella trichopoda]|uniref:Uncharacterized protein n=1 Tax=Amborella trichopoda TaxID=13333 RepID=W1PC02_AMBTC|nr:hypothetical protein AMTR_s00007p00042900 [Amborella trichopoda]
MLDRSIAYHVSVHLAIKKRPHDTCHHDPQLSPAQIRANVYGKYTGEGQGAKKNISPPVEWYGVPEGTKSLALVIQDIDAPDPNGPIVLWTHWFLHLLSIFSIPFILLEWQALKTVYNSNSKGVEYFEFKNGKKRL